MAKAIEFMVAHGADLQHGETIHVNHDTCGDTRGRLYFTRKDKVILGYCHNCQAKGVTDVRGVFSVLPRPPGPTESDPIQLPTHIKLGHPDYKQDTSWGQEAHRELAGVVFDPDAQRACVPIYHSFNISTKVGEDYQGYIARALYKYQRPKYLNYLPKGWRGWTYYWDIHYKGSTIVIVEDVLSAVAVAETKHIAVCTFGAKNNIEKIHDMLNTIGYVGGQCATIVVWYDNDNEYVNESARVTTEYCKLLGYPAKRIMVQCDPKNMTKEEIIKELQ